MNLLRMYLSGFHRQKKHDLETISSPILDLHIFNTRSQNRSFKRSGSGLLFDKFVKLLDEFTLLLATGLNL